MWTATAMDWMIERSWTGARWLAPAIDPLDPLNPRLRAQDRTPFLRPHGVSVLLIVFDLTFDYLLAVSSKWEKRQTFKNSAFQMLCFTLTVHSLNGLLHLVCYLDWLNDIVDTNVEIYCDWCWYVNGILLFTSDRLDYCNSNYLDFNW